jgi:hypothetical protein
MGSTAETGERVEGLGRASAGVDLPKSAGDRTVLIGPERGRQAAARRNNAVLLGVVFVVLVYALFPGRFDADSYNIWLQSADLALISDWQSPLLTVVMSVTREFVAGPAILFVTQLATWFFGLFLLTDALIRSGRRWTGQLISLGCAVPLVSFIFVDVNKDTTLAALGMLLLGLLARVALLGRRPSFLGHLGLFALGVLFLGLRKNAFIALAPLLAAFVYLVAPALRRSPVRWVGASLLALAAMAATEHWIDYTVIGAARTHEERALVMFDLAGVAYFSRQDPSDGLFGPGFVDRARACYSPKFHDPFEWGPCKDYGARLAALVQTKPGRDRLYRTWFSAIAAHPVAYLKHRVSFFNVFMRVDCQQCVDAMTAGVTWERPWRLVPKERVTITGELIQRVAFPLYVGQTGRGVLWALALGVAALALIWAALAAPLGRLGVLALAVVMSALAYPAALLPLGVSFTLRYLHWTIMLAVVGLPLTVSFLHRRFAAPKDAAGR